MVLQGLKWEENIWKTSGPIAICAEYDAEILILCLVNANVMQRVALIIAKVISTSELKY